MNTGITALVLAALTLCPVPPLAAGTITGTVTARGPALAPRSGSGDSGYSSLRYKFAEKIDYARLPDLIVYVDEPLAPAGPGAPATVTQRNVAFEPRILPVAVGTRVRWPNADTIYHNVFSLSEAQSFDLGLYAKDDPNVPELVFDKPGRIDVFCGIHSKMHCIILVLPSPFFAKVNAGQRYVIPGVPAGTHRLRAWHERLPSVAQTVVVPAEGEVTADFTLGLGRPKAR